MWNKAENVVVLIFMINAICNCNFIPNNIKGSSTSEHQRIDRKEHPIIRQRDLLIRKTGKILVCNVCKIFWFIANYTWPYSNFFQIIASIISRVIAMRG